MEKSLFVCNTLLQLINAILIKNSFMQDNYVDIMLTDYTKGMDEISIRLREEEFFNNVYYFEGRNYLRGHGKMHYFQCIADLYLTNSRGIKKELDKIGVTMDYDRFFYYNNIFINWFLSDLNRKQKKDFSQYMMEEGVLGYNKYLFKQPIDWKLARLTALRKKMHKGYLQDDIKAYYCLYPEIIDHPLKSKCIKIPQLADKKIISLLCRIFSYNTNDYPIDEKIIYFAANTDYDGGSIHEERVVEKVVSMVGKENVIVKMHPRDTRDIYEKMGIKVYRGKSVPWEIMAIANDYSDKVFMTLSSSALITANVFKNEAVNAFFLYPLVLGKDPSYDKSVENLGIPNTIDTMKRHGLCKNFEIIQNEDFLKAKLDALL